MLQKFDERNRDLMVNINGQLVHRDKAAVSPFDSVVQGGDAVWEGLRLYKGKIFRLHQHLDRLAASAQALSFQHVVTRDKIVAEIKRTLKANKMSDGVHIRLTLSRGVKYTSGMDPRLNTFGPTLIVLAEFKPPVYSRMGIKLMTSDIRRPGKDVLDAKIHHNNLLNSILAKIQANAAGVDDALMLDGRGFIAETNATNVFLVQSGKVRTPLCHVCPEGITRGAVMELCKSNGIECVERDLKVPEAYAAEEMFCTGTMGELAPVVELDGRKIGKGVGPVTKQLMELFRELTAREGESVV